MTPMDSTEKRGLILIIDDSVDMIRLLSGMLKDLGQVVFATSGEMGLKLARERRPHLILLDVEMPFMDGFEVCRALKSGVDPVDAPVIFVTAHGGMDSEVRALDAGAVDFLTKPLNPPVVRARVRTHLNLYLHSLAMIRLANQDGLTGLFNRRHFDEVIEKEFRRHKRQALPLALALIDIDHFKAYNDTYGHQEGDACLKKVAEAIGASALRSGEVVARYGGEEFVVILPCTLMDAARMYGEKICERIRDMGMAHRHSSCSQVVTISVGVTAGIPTEDMTVPQLLEAADRALYQAKSSGRNRAASM